MSKKDKLTLSSVLESFEKSLQKEAGTETETKSESSAPKVTSESSADKVTETEKKEKKKGNTAGDDAVVKEEGVKEDGDTDDAVAEAEKKASQEDMEVVEGLKHIAKTAAENSTQAMEKEAQEFGKLFAHAVVEELQKTAQTEEELTKCASRAYQIMDDQLFQTKLAFVFDEAYTMASMKCASSEAYNKTASLVGTTEKNAEAIEAMASIDQAKELVKQAYEVTQQYLESVK